MMSKLSRRGFLQRASISIAAVGGVVALPRLASAAQRPIAASTATLGSGQAGAAATMSGQPLVAYVRDLNKGEVSLYVGAREITFRDPDLVARLSKAVS